jgi:hypothetical protein
MLAKTFCFIAFAALALAAPQRNGDRSKQLARVKQLRAQGLVCNELKDGTYYCSDGFGGDWLVHCPLPPLPTTYSWCIESEEP